MEKSLNQLLSDLVIEYHKLQTFHWYVKGDTFFQAHAKLEEYYDDLLEHIDEVAEKTLQIGKKPLGKVADFLKTSHIKETDAEFVKTADVMKEVLKDFEHILDEVKTVKKEAEDKDEILIANLMDDLIDSYSKKVWMLRQYHK